MNTLLVNTNITWNGSQRGATSVAATAVSFAGSFLESDDDTLDRSTAPSASAFNWRRETRGRVLSLEASGRGVTARERDGLALLMRGYAVSPDFAAPRLESLLDHLLGVYRRTGELAVESLEGSFTLALMDSLAGRVVLYRHLAGSTWTYYTHRRGRLWFGGNLAELVQRIPDAPEPNEDMLPAFFMYRTLPGRETLFRGVERLLPGEQVTVDATGLKRQQRLTLGELVRERIGRDVLERTEETTRRILSDCAALHPDAANLLSGGVDSTYLQAHWNGVRRHGSSADPFDEEPASFCALVDHPATRDDAEYARTASRVLGTRHTFVPVADDYAGALAEMIALTGEPPNHVQSAYFQGLARAMVAAGSPVGICGDGADSLFGLGETSLVQVAERLRAVPGEALRRSLATIARRIGRHGYAAALELAGSLHDASLRAHPVNHVAVFTDGPALERSFGRNAFDAVNAARRELIASHGVPGDALSGMHAASFLGSAVNTSSLWTALFNVAGGDLVCPFLDSRMVSLAMSLAPEQRFPWRRPKGLLKDALSRHVPAEMVHRRKRGFAQPIFEWMAPGGLLRPRVEAIGEYPFLERRTLQAALDRPNWFLFSLLCYDVWHRTFIAPDNPSPPPRGRGVTSVEHWS